MLSWNVSLLMELMVLVEPQIDRGQAAVLQMVGCNFSDNQGQMTKGTCGDVGIRW